MQAYLLDNFKVEIDERATEIGGCWQGEPRDGIPTVWGMDELRFFYERTLEYEQPVILDIGANTGAFSILAAMNPAMRSYAFEPAPNTYEILNRNISLNRLDDKIKTFQIALSDRNGTVVLKYPRSGKDSGLACIGEPLRFNEWVEFEVPVRKLDDFATEYGINKVDLLKIDTEGCELLVLKGAQELIRRYHPDIFCEYWEPNTKQFGYHPAKIAKLLASWGYSYTKVGHEDMYFYHSEIDSRQDRFRTVGEADSVEAGANCGIFTSQPSCVSKRIEDYFSLDPTSGKIILPAGVSRVWIDVGAHKGEVTLPYLRHARDLVVIAFEPLIEKCRQLNESHPRMIALPIAISNTEGFVDFYHTENDVSSSLHPFNPAGFALWKNTTGLKVIDKRIVPTIRLEPILERLPLERVEFLKIDAQGHDLDVVKSTGNQLQKIDRIKLEVAVTPTQLYEGAATKAEVVSYMAKHGFKLTETTSQTNGQEENLTFLQVQKVSKACASSLPVISNLNFRQQEKSKAITIFAAPKAFRGHIAVIQRNAIKSWTLLEPKPEIILFGDEEGMAQLAQEMGLRHITDVERNEFGTPLVNNLFEKGQKAASNDTLVYVNTDIILMNDFPVAVEKTAQQFDEFLMVGQRWDVPISQLIDFTNPGWKKWILQQIAEKGRLHPVTGIDYFVFRKHFWKNIPSFALGRATWDIWLVYNALAEQKPLIDTTEVVIAVHQNHDRAHIFGGQSGKWWEGPECRQNRALAKLRCLSEGFISSANFALTKEGFVRKNKPKPCQRPTDYLGKKLDCQREQILQEPAKTQPHHKASLEIVEQQLPHLPGENSLREQSQRLNDAVENTASQNITWEQIKQMPLIRLYAGDVPAQKDYEGVVGLSLTRNDHNHIRHDITKPFPLADNTVDSFQAEDVFEHIQYEKLPTIVNEIYRILKPGGLFRLSVPDYGCDVLQNRCKKSETGQILFDPGGGGTPDNPGHVWFPRFDRVRQLLEQTKFHESGTIEFLHYYNMDGTFVTKPIDYTKGHVTRTPDFDERTKNPYRPMSLIVDLTKATPLHLEIVERDGTNASKTPEERVEENSLRYPSFNALASLLSPRDNYRPTIISTEEVFCGPDCETTMDADKYRTIKSPVGVYDIRQIAERLPPSQTPQLVAVKADATGRNFPINLQTLKCPKLLILGNTQHLKKPIQTLLKYALQENFDFIMSDHKRHHLHYFKEIGFEKVFWLPAFNIFPHKQPYYEDKLYKLSFVGQAGRWHPYRKNVLQYLNAKGIELNIFQVPQPKAAEIYAQSLINLNISLNGDLNLRVFEVLSSGGFLLTDKLTMESGLELLFKDGQHLVCFENDSDLLDKIRYFLKHPDEAKEIAQNGYEEFQRNHTPEKKTKELSDYIFNGELNPLYDIRKDKRSIYVKTGSPTEMGRRVALYEFFQEIHLTTTSASILLWPNVDGRLACDVLDLPRLRLFIKNDDNQIPDQNTQLFQNTDMAERIKLVTTEQLGQTNLFWNVLVITASELLTAGLENLLNSMKFKWLVISDGFDALGEQQKKQFKDILAAAGFEKKSEDLEIYYWKDKNLWGEILYSENKISEAINCFEQALLENPCHCDALNNLGVISFQLEQLEDAEKFLLKAVRLNRRSLTALINLSHLYLRMNRFDDATELFEEAASLDKDDPSVWFHLGLCYEQSNRNREALLAYKRCNELGASEWPTAEKIQTLEKRTAAKRRKKTSKIILPPKRILVINNLYPPQELGGYGRLLCDLADILENRGHCIYVLTSDTPYLGPIDQEQPNVDRSLLLFGSWQNGVCRPIEDKEKIIRIIKKNHEKLQNAIEHFSPQLCLLGNIDFLSHSIFRPLLESGIPIIHHLGSPNPGYSVADTPKEALYVPAAASRWLKEQIVQQGYTFKDFRVIYPGALVQRFKMNILPDMDKLRIAYASIVLPYKGPHILIKALKELHDKGIDFSCSLAGTSTDEKFVNSLKNFVTQTGMDEKVAFVGFLSREDLKNFFARHNVLAFPSIVSEAFGISQVEAMAAGLTVVTSGTGGAKEIVEHRLSGVIFNSGDHKSLAQELLQLTGDKERWRQIALEGQKRALQCFDIEKSVDDMERIYCHLTQHSENDTEHGKKIHGSASYCNSANLSGPGMKKRCHRLLINKSRK